VYPPDVPAHHRFKIDVVCPGCGQAGAIRVVEDLGPPFTDTPRRAYIADSGSFILSPEEDAPEVECQACGVVFRRPLR
jgi:hypothetical protein